ncbi:hypothetical protein [Aeromonas veronii]|uniref:hypothetical protein n=1 Tax=Aeromonas veronii TaxID=654 RepID=UPI0038D681A9
MTVNSFILQFYLKACEPKKLNLPTMPAKANQKALAAIANQAVAQAEKQATESTAALSAALASVPREWPELTNEVIRIDAEIVKVLADMAKRPRGVVPSMNAAIRFAKAVGSVDVAFLIDSCTDDSELLALHGVCESEGLEVDSIKVLNTVSNRLVGYNAAERLAELETEKREICSYAEQVQEAMVQAIGKQFAPHLVQAAEKAKFGL